MGEDRTPLPMDDGKVEVEKERTRRKKDCKRWRKEGGKREGPSKIRTGRET